MQRRVFNKCSSRGMSLVEMIVVLAIMSVVIMATMSLYVPAQRATVVQTQVTDIQANLRLAMNRLSMDLLTAGFLVTGQPIVFESGTNEDPVDFTVRTRLIGSGFGRVSSAGVGAAGADVRLNLTSPDMAAQLPVNSLVRLVEPITGTECNEAFEADPTKRVYQVVSSDVDDNGTAGDPGDDFAVINIDDPNNGLAVVDVNPETVVVRVVSNLVPPVQTIRYQFADNNGDGTRDTLLRIVNGDTQFMARELSDVAFGYNWNSDGKIRRVDITLSGQTRAIVAGDPVSGAKTRTLQSAVTLRNVF